MNTINRATRDKWYENSRIPLSALPALAKYPAANNLNQFIFLNEETSEINDIHWGKRILRFQKIRGAAFSAFQRTNHIELLSENWLVLFAL